VKFLTVKFSTTDCCIVALSILFVITAKCPLSASCNTLVVAGFPIETDLWSLGMMIGDGAGGDFGAPPREDETAVTFAEGDTVGELLDAATETGGTGACTETAGVAPATAWVGKGVTGACTGTAAGAGVAKVGVAERTDC
jgi:hypothetical protein